MNKDTIVGILAALGGVILLLPSVGKLELPVGPQKTVPQSNFSEDSVWDTLGDWVERSDTRISDTDFVVKMVDRLKENGVVTDDSRIDTLRSQNEVLNDTKRREVANLLRGN